jgi:type IV secretion system protein VirB8
MFQNLRPQPAAAPRAESGQAPVPEQAAKWFLDQAMAFERSKAADAKSSKKIAWTVAGASLFVTLVTVVTAGIVVHNNKPNPPAVWAIDGVTGEIRQLKTLTDGKIEYGRATDLFYLRRYVELRESYDWETIQDSFDATIALSSPKEASAYRAFNAETNPLAPVNVLRDKYRVIAKAGTVTWVGKTALVTFSKKTISLTGDKRPVIKYYVATIAYGYENVPLDDKDRGVNVPGFKALSYRVDADITKDAAVASDKGEGEGS